MSVKVLSSGPGHLSAEGYVEAAGLAISKMSYKIVWRRPT